MEIKSFVVGPLQTNAYLLIEEQDAALVDPGGLCPEMLQALEDVGLRYILLTHGHFDHAEAAETIHRKTGAPIFYHPEEKVTFWSEGRLPPPLEKSLRDGDRLALGGEELLVWHLPGHSPGSVAYLWEKGKVAIVGDVLFASSVGRTDLPGGSWEALARSLARIIALGDDWRVLPGHGPETKLGWERERNPFVRGVVHGAA